MSDKKRMLTKSCEEKICDVNGVWSIRFGCLKRQKGNPGVVNNLFKVVGEKIPYEALAEVEAHLKEQKISRSGIYMAHDSMGTPRYIGRGSIFTRLKERKNSQSLELAYFSFYIVLEKKHEREIETLLIRAAGPLLEFNTRKKRVGIAKGDIKDFEAGTLFYERQYKKGRQT